MFKNFVETYSLEIIDLYLNVKEISRKIDLKWSTPKFAHLQFRPWYDIKIVKFKLSWDLNDVQLLV